MRDKHPQRCTATIAISYQKSGRGNVVREDHIESKIGKEFALDKCMTKSKDKRFQKRGPAEDKRFQKRGLGVDFGTARKQSGPQSRGPRDR